MILKAAAFDLDGTLLDSSSELRASTVKALQKLKKLGIAVIIVTGRRYLTAERFVKDLGFKPYIISSNGSISLSEDWTVIEKNIISQACFNKLYSIFNEMEIYPVVHLNSEGKDYDLACFERGFERNSNYVNSAFDKVIYIEGPEELAQEEVLGMSFMGSFEELSMIQKASEGIEDIKSMMLMRVVSAEGFLDINDVSAGKGPALLRLLEKLGIDPKNAVAFGDDANDICMIKELGMGIAMENGIDELKKNADMVSFGTNDGDAIYDTLAFLIGESFERA